MQVTAQWNRLLREVTEFPSLEIFVNHLGCNPVQCALGKPCLNREVGPKVFSKLTHSVNRISHARFLFLSLEQLPHQQGKGNRVLSNSSTQHNLLHTLTTVQFADGGVWDGIKMVLLGLSFLKEVCVCVCLYTEGYF